MQRYEITKRLGDGTYGSVWMAKNKKSGEMVAIKTLKRKFTSWDECMTLRELKSLRSLPQDVNIVQIKELIREDDSQLHFVFEYMKDGNLYQLMKEALIKSKKPLHGSCSDRNSITDFSPGRIQSIVHQVLKGLSHIHSLGFVHRDIKPENLLLHGNVCKIADFGLARKPRMKPDSPAQTAYISTRWYRAPEVLLRHPNYSHKIDIFAVGLVMAEMIELKPLFPGSSEIDQIHKVFSMLGKPSRHSWPEGVELLDRIKLPLNMSSPVSIVENNPNAMFNGCKRCFPGYDPSIDNLYKALPNADAATVSFVHKLLRMNPQNRLSAQDATLDPYFGLFGQSEHAKIGKESSTYNTQKQKGQNNLCLNASTPFLEAEAMRQESRKKSRSLRSYNSNHRSLREPNINGLQLNPSALHNMFARETNEFRPQQNGAVSQIFKKHDHNLYSEIPSTKTGVNVPQQQQNPFSIYDHITMGNQNITKPESMHLNSNCL